MWPGWVQGNSHGPLVPMVQLVFTPIQAGNPRQSLILDSTQWIPDSRSLSVGLGLWIPFVSGIPDSLSCIPDSKAQDSTGFPRFWNPDSLTCGKWVMSRHPNLPRTTRNKQGAGATEGREIDKLSLCN